MNNNDYLGSARFLLPFLIIKGHPELKAIARDIALAVGLATGPGRGSLATRLKEEERWRSVLLIGSFTFPEEGRGPWDLDPEYFLAGTRGVS
ncbi:hypothetical protein DY000_02020542 [Brassica cretica]|uniref:Uncharacterized protein n=1 Tax=Brassica cretica TaxID=69181 RepID=A0ABQ7EIJ0_BRACR|nr:hypothetical protein DY000_02020542 [Brassica cretica]